MNIRMRPFLISAGAAALTQILLSAGSTMVGYLMIPTDLPSMMNGPDQFPFLMVQVTALVGCLSTILIGVTEIGSGILYSLLHNREISVSPEEGAGGGAASAAAASVIGALTTAAVSLIVAPLIMQRMFGSLSGDLGMPPGSPPFNQIAPMVLFGTTFGMIGTAVSACIGAVIAAALGAAGGAITAAVISHRKEPEIVEAS